MPSQTQTAPALKEADARSRQAPLVDAALIVLYPPGEQLEGDPPDSNRETPFTVIAWPKKSADIAMHKRIVISSLDKSYSFRFTKI